MAAKVLEDVLNNFISIDSLLEWLSTRNAVSDVSVFANHYKCNQVEFASFFLNFLREQSSRILQSTCSIETPCKSSQLQKSVALTSSFEKSCSKLKSDGSLNSTGKKLDLKSLDSFPALTDGSAKSSRISNKSCGSKCNDSLGKDVTKSSVKRSRRLELFPEKKEGSPGAQSQTSLNESRSAAVVSTPKLSGRETVDIADYFSDIVNLDGSPNWSPGFRLKKDSTKNENEKVRENCNSVPQGSKSKSFGGNSDYRNRDLKSTSRRMLGDFIVNDGNSNDRKDKKNKVKKRINPTRVSSSSSHFEGSSSFDITNSTVENDSSITDERQALKMECASLLEKLEGEALLDGYKINKDPVPPRLFSTPSKKVVACADSATYVDELKILSRIYSFIMDESYCQNIMIEMCFLISLLVIQDHNALTAGNQSEVASNTDGRNYLDTIHNCVFFAVETLWLQRNILVLLNLAALRLLSENREIENFNLNLKEFLERAYIDRQNKEMSKRQICGGKGTRQGNVSFEYETDNKDNFTDVMNFHSFRKQRDLFYNILAIWEENHLTSGWVFSVTLDSKIRTLLSICSDPTNLLHLARLFRNQLVMSCCGDYRLDEESDEEILQLLASVDPNKIQRLRARLRSIPKRQGPCPPPDFMGYQEFFKDFIVATSFTVFHNYLKNSLCDEILRLNESEFSSDMEDDDSCLDQQTQNRYLQHINVLCLLAKFLGFLEFLPYRSDKQWSDRVLSVHCAVRQNLLPLFDVESCLKAALTRHKLTVTVPWIVSYLSMIDYCSARLRTYQNIWKIFISIYRQLATCKNLMNSFYLKLILGWIFQLPNFPSDMFYNILEDGTKGSSLDLYIEFSVGLDSYNFIEEDILYSVCPFLNEINSILTENTGCNVKHIRPVTQGSSSTSSQAAKQLQLRLEESFLHNQSSSTRKTIDFVIERVSSIAVKYLINDVISKVKERALEEINELSIESVDATEKVDAISEKCYKDLISSCERESWLLCSVRAEKALSALLSLDLDSAVTETCTQIVVRQSTEKVKRWIQTHITIAIIKKEFTTIHLKNSKKLADTLDLTVDNCNSSFVTYCSSNAPRKSNWEISNLRDGMSVSNVLTAFREIAVNIYEGGKIVWTEINNTLKTALRVIETAGDIVPIAEKTLLGLTVDLLVIICLRCESSVKKENFVHFCRFIKRLKEFSRPGSALDRLICPRNVTLLLRDSKNKNKSWENLGKVFLCLMDEDLLTQDQVETQLVSLLRRNWVKEEGELFTKLLSHVLHDYTDKKGCDQFTLLLEYLIESLCEDEDCQMMMD